MPFRAPAPAIVLILALVLCACERAAPAADDVPTAASGPQDGDPATPSAVDVAEPNPLPRRTRSTWKPTPVLVPDGARDALLRQAAEAEAAGHDYGKAPLGALDVYLAVAEADPANSEAIAGRDRVVARLSDRFEEALLGGRLEIAEDVALVLDTVRSDAAPARLARLTLAREATADVALGDERREAGRWLAPRGQSAVAAYRSALSRLPGFAPAQEGLAGIEKGLIDAAADELARGAFDAADESLRRAGRVGASPEAVQDARAALALARASAASAAVAEANAAVDRLDLVGAARALAAAGDADPQAPGIDELSKRLALARRYGHFQPGQRFADTLSSDAVGPAMVVLPHGAFTMGAGPDEGGARDNERPAHEVRFERGFALAVRETTVAEFARFVAETGYRTVAERRGRSTAYDERGGAMVELRGAHWRRGYQGRAAAQPDDPVIHVAFDDAVAYAEWLSARTGLRYRLPSEAEFEYALRGGETGTWPWGRERPAFAWGNLTGDGDVSPQGRRWGRPIRGWSDGFWGPAPTGRFPPEPFGTQDLVGNVSEWVEDCWHDSYRRAPRDGRAWVNPGCDERVVRGASWASTLEQSRSAFRLQVPASLTSARIGFRVAREL